jgi:adenylate cyclase, class 2
MQNIEIKARYGDLEKGRRIARSLGASYMGRDHQVDTYFKVPKGRMKIRESSLSGAQLIPYLRSDVAAPRASQYMLIPLPEPAATKEILEGILEIDCVVDKKRDIFLIENVRIHLDDVCEAGTFFELEAVCQPDSDLGFESKKVEKYLRMFEVTIDQVLDKSYREIINFSV